MGNRIDAIELKLKHEKVRIQRHYISKHLIIARALANHFPQLLTHITGGSQREADWRASLIAEFF